MHLQNSLSHVLTFPVLGTHLGIGQGDIPMWKSIFLGLAGCALLSSSALAQSCGSYPYTLTNGNVADASQVMSNLSYMSGCLAPLTSPSFTGTLSLNTLKMSATPGGGPSTLVVQSFPATDVNDAYTLNLAPAGGAYTYYNINVTGTDIFSYGGSLSPYANALALTSPAGPILLRANGYSAVTIVGNAVGIETGSPSYTLHVNGSVAGTSAYVNLSDERLKKNIRQIYNALSLVEKLHGVRFQWKDVGERQVGKSLSVPVGQSQVGFIAQDVEKILPEAVSTASGPDAIKSVAESKVVPVLVEAVKELKAANDNQAAELRDLKTQMIVLERKVKVQIAQR
jgi:hypothetical protein